MPNPSPQAASARSAWRNGPNFRSSSVVCQVDICTKAIAAMTMPSIAACQPPKRLAMSPPRTAPTGTPTRNRVSSNPESS